MSARPEGWRYAAVKILTGNIFPGGVRLAQLHQPPTCGHKERAFRQTYSSYRPPCPFRRWSSVFADHYINPNPKSDPRQEIHLNLLFMATAVDLWR